MTGESGESVDKRKTVQRYVLDTDAGPRAGCVIDSPVGPLQIIVQDGVLVRLFFQTEQPQPVDKSFDSPAGHPLLAQVAGQLAEYFAGSRKHFDLPLRLHGTAFQQRVWTALTKIPFGQTRSYRQQADTLGKSSATRAVGAANGRNPIAIIVPCHRVIGAGGALTGFGGGLPAKRWLLSHEGVLEAELPGLV